MPRTAAKQKSPTSIILDAFMGLKTDQEGDQIIEVLQTLQARMRQTPPAGAMLGEEPTPPPAATASRARRGGGRPKGSVNKPKGPQAAGPLNQDALGTMPGSGGGDAVEEVGDLESGIEG